MKTAAWILAACGNGNGGDELDGDAYVYLWSNTFNGREVTAEDTWVDDQGYQQQDIVEGRNYSFAPMPGYVPYPYPHPLTVVP